jgi:prephenate dehydrogenase
VLARDVFAHVPGLHIVLADIDRQVHAARLELAEHHDWDRFDSIQLVYTDDGIEGIRDWSGIDAVMLGVGFDQLQLVLDRICPHLPDGTLLFDITSVKAAPVDMMLSASAGRLSVVGLHPLFGPRVKSVVGENVVLCPTEDSLPGDVEWLSETFRSSGIVVSSLEAHEHDGLTPYVQALVHFAIMTVARVLVEEGVDVSRAIAMQPPPFKALLGLSARILETPGVYAAIQQGPGVAERRRAFRRVAAFLDESCSSEEGLADELRVVRETFGDSLLKEALAGSDTVASGPVALHAAVHEYLRSGEICGITDVVSGRTVVGRVESIERTTIEMRDCLVRDSKSGTYALVYDDGSAATARRLGLARGGAPPVVPLPKATTRVLSRSELHDWKLAHLKRHVLDVTVAVSDQIDPAALASFMPRLVDGVATCALIDVFYPPRARCRVTLRLKVLGDVDPETARTEVLDTVNAFVSDPPDL